MVLYDAILIHAYWLSQEKDKTVTLSFRSASAVKAGALLFRNSPKKPFLVITGGAIWGDRYPSLGEVMAQELEATYNIPQEKIICLDTAFDTSGEIQAFADLIQDHKWQSVASLAWKKHFSVINTLYKNRHICADFLAVEDILLKYADTQTKQQVKWFLSSRYEFFFRIYEYFLRLLLVFDSRYRLLGMIAKKTRKKKMATAILPFMPIDKYTL